MQQPYYYNPQFNTMGSQQMRLNQMEQQYPQFAQQPYQYPYQQQMQQSQQQQSLKGRPVTSVDEAKASMIDLDGSVFVFPDFGSKKIYTKQINLDGTASLNTYTLETQPMSSPQSSEVIKSEPNYTELINKLQSEIDSLKDEINTLKQSGGMNNEPVRNESNAAYEYGVRKNKSSSNDKSNDGK